ncbi:MAG: adenylate/guanylate cyclase domain-containing protein [Lachnospiraceae bacterium]|nr:adenylate/guanylate cyclase domain-containing protein [Lachnospiraceae bacterium]
MKKLLRDLVESLIVIALVFLLTITNLFSHLDYMLKDALYQIPRGVSSQIKIIAIDDKTLEELGPINTWSRQYYADLINILNSNENSKPAVIAFDILFSGYFGDNNTIAEGDMEFAEAAKESGNVVAVAQYKYNEKAATDENGLIVYPVDAVYYPYEELRDVVSVGYSNVAQDSDGVVRRIAIEQSYQGEDMYMFSKVIYDMYCDNNDSEKVEIPTDKYGKTLINFSGKPGDYECISMVDVLDGKIDPRAFTGSIVLVGAYATGMQDNFNVPNGYSKQMFGVEIHANILQSLMDGRFSINANPIATGIITGIICGIIHFIFKRSKIWLSTILLLVAVGAQIFVGITLNNNGKSISLVYAIIVLIVSYVYCLAIGYILEKIKRKKVINAFKKYVAPEVVEEISKKGDFSIKLGGENRDVAVLFVDIRGFTTMSEILEPEQVVAILNNYLNLTTDAIFKNKGTLDKFIGDATMAVFNSPFDLEDYTFKAVCAAMDIVDGAKALEDKLMKEFGRSIGFGVGVNCGPAIVGNIGCEFRMDFTAIGDTVNTAARLESNAKRGQVLISDMVYERVKDRVEVEEVGEIPLKGKSNGVFVYSVVSVNRD